MMKDSQICVNDLLEERHDRSQYLNTDIRDNINSENKYGAQNSYVQKGDWGRGGGRGGSRHKLNLYMEVGIQKQNLC